MLGLGYVGLPTASILAANGHSVVGVDVSQKVVNTLRNGGVHIHEKGLKTLVEDAIGSGNLVIGSEPEEADIFVIATPSPITSEKRADLRAIETSAESIVPHVRKGNLIILGVHCPPGHYSKCTDSHS